MSRRRVRAGSASGGAHSVPIPQGSAWVPPTCSFLPVLPRQPPFPLFITASSLSLGMRTFRERLSHLWDRNLRSPSEWLLAVHHKRRTLSPGLSRGCGRGVLPADTSPRPYLFFICLKNVIVHDNLLKLVTVNKSTLLLSWGQLFSQLLFVTASRSSVWKGLFL